MEKRNTARVERGAEDVPMELGNGEQMADRHAVASGVEEKITRREQNERHPHSAKADREQQMKNNRTN